MCSSISTYLFVYLVIHLPICPSTYLPYLCLVIQRYILIYCQCLSKVYIIIAVYNMYVYIYIYTYMILIYACTYVSTYVVTCRDQTQCGGLTDSMSIDAAATATSLVSALSKDCGDN